MQAMIPFKGYKGSLWSTKEVAKILDSNINAIYRNAKRLNIDYQYPAVFSDSEIDRIRNNIKTGKMSDEMESMMGFGIK